MQGIWRRILVKSPSTWHVTASQVSIAATRLWVDSRHIAEQIMTGRRRAREIALQVLYQIDLNPKTDEEVIGAFIRGRLREAELIKFARSLVNGVRRNRAELDTLLEQTADNWNLRRMAAIDRNVLRLGAYEILFAATPQRVAINEAVELAKRFGGADSSRFVNGILDRFLTEGGE